VSKRTSGSNRERAPECRGLSDRPAVEAVRSAIADALDRLREQEPAARAFDPEGVHRMRAAVRRLRSVLRTFRPLIEERWARAFADELEWLADLLGAVRDLDVLRQRYSSWTDRDSCGSILVLLAALDDRLAKARDDLARGIESDRYRRLLASWEEAGRRPRTGDAGDEPCRSALPRRVADAARVLRRAGRRLEADDPDRAFHEVRILAKRARYAAEAVAPALDDRRRPMAERFARRAAKIQDALGKLQDAVLARRFLRSMIADERLDRGCVRALNRSLKSQRKEARARFARVWRKFDRPKMIRWAEV
jgi:CHAD domain-containing protein